MNPQLKALHDKQQTLLDEAEALAKVETMDDEQYARASTLTDEIDANKAQIKALSGLDASAASANEQLNGRTADRLASLGADVTDETVAGLSNVAPHEFFKAIRKLSARGTHPFLSQIIEDRYEARQTALAMGHIILSMAPIEPRTASRKWCEDNNVNWQAASGQSEFINEDGGYLVPEEFERVLIILREQFGIFRQHAEIVPMGSDTKWQPRQTQGLTATFTSEGTAITTSRSKFDRVNLVAKKLAALAFNTTEVDEDSVVALGDRLVANIAYAFSKKEDQAGFTGDGTSTFGTIVGVAQQLIDRWTVAPSSGEGLILAAGNEFSDVTLGNLQDMQGNLPEYAEMRPQWFCHKRVWSVMLMRIALASGGVPAAEILMGGEKRILGDPVVITQAMPRVDANSSVPLTYGTLAMAAMFGDRRGVTIAESIHHKFAEDEIAFRGTERFDIVVHSVESPEDTTEPGPILGLVMAAS